MLERGLLVGYFDAPGQQRLVVLEARCLWQRSKQRAQVPVGFDAIRLGRFDQGIQIGTGARPADGVGEQPVAPTQGHHAVILPISGKKLKFTTAGIRFTADMYVRSTVSNALTVVSSTLRSNLVL